MQTRCPACQTLYRIDEEVLERAGGQARCFRCDTVFDAYQHPADGPDLPSDDADPVPIPDDEDASGLGALDPLPAVPDHNGLGADSELDLDDLAASLHDQDIDADANPFAADDLDAERLPPLSSLDTVPGLDDDDQASSAADTPTAPAHPGPSLGGAVLAVLLALLALAQVAWFNRDQVLAMPLGRALAQGVCQMAGCELPPRRAPSRYTVLERDIGPDPEHTGVLRLQLSLRNDADFAQPLPDVQLSLYDSEEKLMARRRLHPPEYLFPAPAPGTEVGPGEVIQITVRLEDPGRHATGFKLEFL